MKKYQLHVFIGNVKEHYIVFAEKFSTQTNNSTSSGFYAFYADNKLVACYPICRTAIISVEEIEESE
jgi:hypothetical protein